MSGLSARGQNFPRFLTRFPTLWFGLILVLGIFVTSMLKGQFGEIGPDNDDVF